MPIEKPSDARVFCTFRGDVKTMYQKVKKRFVGDLCHAIVFGIPLVINDDKVVIDNDAKRNSKL